MYEPDYDEISLAFELDIYHLGRRLFPRNGRVLDGLSLALCMSGRYAEAEPVLRELTTLKPENPRVRYNLACTLCRLERPEEAMLELGRAVEEGFRDAEIMARDPDIEPLRALPGFEELQKRVRAQAIKSGRSDAV
jgi:tetratricopeptide (TPR) repeat protein